MNLTPLHEYFRNRSGEEQNNNIERMVAASLIHIVGYYFAAVSNDFVLTITCRREHNISVFYNDVMDKFFYDGSNLPLQIVNVQKIAGHKRIEAYRRYNMILTDSYESFLEADLNSYTKDNSFNEYYFVFLQQYHTFVYQDMQKIFEYCWQHNLINFVIQIQNANGELLVYTYYPFTELACNQVKITLINQFNGTSLVHNKLFPKKLMNLHGCPLKVATWEAPPYVFLSTNSRGDWTIAGGFEGKLMMGLSNRMNFTMDIRVPPNKERRGTISANGVLTGALKMLHNREVDLSFGSFRLSSERNKIVTATLNYHQSTFSLAAIDNIYLLNSLETLLFPFDHTLWIVILFVLLVAIGMAAFLAKTMPKNFSISTMDILRMLMGMGPIYQPKLFVERLLNISWMMYTLLIRTIYQALLFHLIRTHITTDVPKSIDDFPQRGYTMVINGPSWDVLTRVSALNSINKLRVNTSVDFSSMAFLENLSLKEAKMYIAALPMDFIKYYILEKQREGVFRIFPYDVMLFKVCTYLTKHSYLIEQFDELLIWIQSSGLIECWYREVLGRSYTMTIKNREDRLFGLAEMEMAFVLLACCLVVSFLVFTMELLYNWKMFNICSLCYRIKKK